MSAKAASPSANSTASTGLGFTGVTSAFLVVVALAMGCQPTVPRSSEMPLPSQPGVYDTPDAVFEVYRRAAKTGDMRTMISCMTPDLRREVLTQTYLACLRFC